MPFARFSRDKRGYDHVYLIHSSTRQGRLDRPRILYCHRTPAGARIGREPFDETVRRALEEHYPDLDFEWSKLQQMATAPSPEAEAWRDRRRTNRAAAAASRHVESEGSDEEIPDPAEPPRAGQVEESPAAAELSGPFIEEDDREDGGEQPVSESAPESGAEAAVSASASAPQTAPASPTSDSRGPGRRRRRRRRRGGSQGGEPGPGSASV